MARAFLFHGAGRLATSLIALLAGAPGIIYGVNPARKETQDYITGRCA
jgi:hypothetical protein